MIDGVDHETGLKRGTDYYICAADDYNLSRPGTKARTQPPIVEKATVSVLSAQKVGVTWKPPDAGNIVGYYIERADVEVKPL